VTPQSSREAFRNANGSAGDVALAVGGPRRAQPAERDPDFTSTPGRPRPRRPRPLGAGSDRRGPALARTTSTPVARVAAACGFADVVTFRQNFVSACSTTRAERGGRCRRRRNPQGRPPPGRSGDDRQEHHRHEQLRARQRDRLPGHGGDVTPSDPCRVRCSTATSSRRSPAFSSPAPAKVTVDISYVSQKQLFLTTRTVSIAPVSPVTTLSTFGTVPTRFAEAGGA